MGLMIESNARFVGREEIAQVPTPIGTVSWKPVPHMEVIDAVGDVAMNSTAWRGMDRSSSELCGSTAAVHPNGAAASASATAMTAVCRSV